MSTQAQEIPERATAARKYLVEAIGSVVLIFTIGAAVRSGSTLAPLAIGAVLMAMVYAGGHISGAHYNPAVTLAVLVRRRIGLKEAVGYWIAQCAGGMLGAALVLAIVDHGQLPRISLPGHQLVEAAIAEAVFTFVLCYVVLNVATSKDHPGNDFYGLAIGFTVLAGAVALGGLTGAAFNPAVVIGVLTLGVFTAGTAFWFIAAQLLAAVLAGLTFRFLNPGDQ